MRHPYDRVTFDGEVLDEIVLHNVHVHIEGLDQHCYMLRIDGPNGEGLHLTVADPFIHEMGGVDDITKRGEPIAYDCPVMWVSGGRTHQCVGEVGHTLHCCDCDAES